MNKNGYRLLILIAAPKFADKATDIYTESKVPLHYTINDAKGTAPSEIMDILGLGDPDKHILLSLLPTASADKMLGKIYRRLTFGVPGNGIAFTIPLDSASGVVVHLLSHLDGGSPANLERKEDTSMAEYTNSLIIAAVNHGYSEELMNVARAYGARGGTVIHSRAIADEKALSFWGVTLHEEKEIVMIISSQKSKHRIMQAISEKCGMNSDAKGLVFSVPIDKVMGLNFVSDEDIING